MPPRQPNIGPEDRDRELILRIEAEVFRGAGGRDALLEEVPKILRRAIDEVIDAPRTGRLTLDETEKTEKTYLGTKVEILFRNFIGFPKGILDLDINGQDVDVKNTVGDAWMIPTEAVDKPCIVFLENEKTFRYRMGLVIARREYLGDGDGNKDKKKNIGKNFPRIHWVAYDQPYPQNFWAGVSKDVIAKIVAGETGNERVQTLFRLMPRTPIPRSVIETVGRQVDNTRRVRSGGGGRDGLTADYISVIAGRGNSELIASLGLPHCNPDEHIAVRLATKEEWEIVEKARSSKKKPKGK